MSDAQRQATKRYRARRGRQGLRRIEVQVPAGQAAVIRKAATVLRDSAEDAERLRKHLGFDLRPGRIQTAVDIFAMTEPPTPQAEALWDEAMAKVERDRKNRKLNRMRKLDL